MSIQENYYSLKKTLPKGVTLVVVSKMQPIDKIKELYELGHREFAENKVQELLLKKEQLPKDIHWHLIGHLQTNKVKQIIDCVSLIQSVDSLKLLQEIQKEAQKQQKKIAVLLQIKVAQEESKYGLTPQETEELINRYKAGEFSHIEIKGFMGMATFTEDENQIIKEFNELKNIKERYPEFPILSMGMSGDYQLAVANGSNLVRIGSSIFLS